MALTLVESAKIAAGRDEVHKATVMELYAKNSMLMQYLPFENISGNAITFNREQTLPNVAFRGVNEAYTEGTGTLAPVTESLAIAGGDLDVDTFIVKTGGMDQRAIQEALKIKALSLYLTKVYVKGDVSTTPKGFDGLQVRCTGNQLIQAGTTANGTPLSLLKLDELIDAVEDPTHLIMNKTMRRRLTAAARTTSVSGYITYDVDAFGRQITKYNDLPILVVDKDESNTDIMPFTEAASSGTATATSIYCVSLSEDGLIGLQNDEMDVRDLGEIQSQPVFRTRIEWFVSMALLRARAAARLYSISNAAVTA